MSLQTLETYFNLLSYKLGMISIQEIYFQPGTNI